MADDKKKKVPEGLAPEEEKLFKEMMLKEIKSRMLKKIDDKDPDFYKTLKIFMDDEHSH